MPPGIGVSEPSDRRQNALTLGVPPELRTYTRPRSSSTLVGATPRDGDGARELGAAAADRNTETLSEPALTA